MPSKTNIVDPEAVVERCIELNTTRQRVSETTAPLTIVAYDWESLRNQDKIQVARMPHSFTKNLLFMGMITNMPGHCLVIDHDGIGHWGCHPESFFVVSEEEA
jgi:hypothetical protein